MDSLCRGSHAELFRHRRVDEISHQATFGEEFPALCCHAVVIEERGTARAGLKRVVDDVDERRDDLFAEFACEERRPLLQGLSVHGVEDGLEEVAGTRRLQYHAVASAGCGPLSYLAKRPFQSSPTDAASRHLTEEDARLAPAVHGMLTAFAFHGDDARQGAIAALLAGIEAVTY